MNSLSVTASFVHFTPISESDEKRIWKANINDWNSFLESPPYTLFSKQTLEAVIKEIRESQRALEEGNALFFFKKFKQKHRPRLVCDFSDQIGFLDIETTGLDSREDSITVISFLHCDEMSTFVSGRNLEEFCELAERVPLWATFNGDRFDLGFIRRKFDGFSPQGSLDLYPSSRYLGLRGGLKKIEMDLGFTRDQSQGLSGRDAVRLWHLYRRREDEEALDTLVAYNREDVKSLPLLLSHLMTLSYSGHRLL